MNSKRITVPFHAIGLVVGQGGSKIKWLGRYYKCEVQFLRSEADDKGNTPLYIRSQRGHFEDVIAVQSEVEHLVSVTKALFSPNIVFPNNWYKIRQQLNDMNITRVINENDTSTSSTFIRNMKEIMNH